MTGQRLQGADLRVGSCAFARYPTSPCAARVVVVIGRCRRYACAIADVAIGRAQQRFEGARAAFVAAEAGADRRMRDVVHGSLPSEVVEQAVEAAALD